MIGMREILRHFANVSANDVVGMRAPFLKPGRNTQYKVSASLCKCPSHMHIQIQQVQPLTTEQMHIIDWQLSAVPLETHRSEFEKYCSMRTLMVIDSAHFIKFCSINSKLSHLF